MAIGPVQHLIVFSRHEYAYRATPGNLIVRREPETDHEILFRNMTDQDITVAPVSWRNHTPGQLRVPAGQDATLPVASLPDGQYFYDGLVGNSGLKLQGGSGPGIIITR